jgi:protocatechuate 3,4-dioxygenase, beta subunit
MKFNRRFLVKSLAVLPAISAWSLQQFAFAQGTKLRPTPQDVEGPYYPISWAGDVDNDLTTYGDKKYVGGIPMALRGLVRGENGEILKNARVEIWQIDSEGDYRHPDFGGEKPASRGFQGYGYNLTNDSGQYTFKTIKPIGYSGRPAHVHFKVIASGYKNLVTEMYFVGENTEFSLWQRWFGGFSKERDLLSVTPKITNNGNAQGLDVVFDVVLARVG